MAQSDRGICAILLGDDPDSLARDLQDQFPQANLIGGNASFEQLVAKVVGFVEAPALGLDLPLDVRGTAFQQRVWQSLRKIPVASAFSGPRDAIATHRNRNSFNSSGGAVRRDLRWAVSISRGGACPRMSANSPVRATPPRTVRAAGTPGCSAKSACHGSRLRARRGGPVRGHPREANVTGLPHLVGPGGGQFLGSPTNQALPVESLSSTR